MRAVASADGDRAGYADYHAPPLMRLPLLALSLFVLGGAAAGWLVSEVVPAALREQHHAGRDFVLARKPDRPVEITDASWFFVPSLYADFDLRMDVELGEGVDLDVLLRQVEPRLADGQLPPFQGRFAVLRLSTREPGPGWHHRDEVLLGERRGGVDLAAGHAATVWIEARGRVLTANVAGKQQGSFVADDEYGMLTLLVRGGTAVLHNLVVTDRGQPWQWLWSRWLWLGAGAAGAAGIAWIARALGERSAWFARNALVPPLLAWLLCRRADPDLAWPSPVAMAGLLGASLLGSLPAWRAPVLARLVLPLAVAAALAVLGVQRLRHDTRWVDAMFGPNAGSQLAEAHAQLVRGPGGLHDVRAAKHRVFLLGGQLLYDRGEPAQHLELVVGRELRAALGAPVDVPCPWTADGHAQQQWRLFTKFFTGFRPRVVVLGVGAGEDAVDPATGEPRSSRAQLAATVRAAREHCEANGSRLVLLAERAVSPALHGALHDAEREGVPLVFADDGEAPPAIAKKLGAVIAPLLK